MSRGRLTLLALALLVGCAAAFTYTEALKLETKPIGRGRVDRWFSPVCECPQETARVSFLVREPVRIDVRVVDEDGDVVRTLASGVRRQPGRAAFTWDGRDDTGRVAPDGEYRVRVRLLDERRTIVIPEGMNLDTKAPRVQLHGATPSTLVFGDTLEVRYSSSEAGAPVLVVEGDPVLQASVRRSGSRTVRWPDVLAELTLAPGTPLAFAVVDRAGNISEPTGPVTFVTSAG